MPLASSQHRLQDFHELLRIPEDPQLGDCLGNSLAWQDKIACGYLQC